MHPHRAHRARPGHQFHRYRRYLLPRRSRTDCRQGNRWAARQNRSGNEIPATRRRRSKRARRLALLDHDSSREQPEASRNDHIDLYQMHRPDLQTDLDETLEALTNLVTQGKVRYLGCSTFRAGILPKPRPSAVYGSVPFRKRKLPLFDVRTHRGAGNATCRAILSDGFHGLEPAQRRWLTGKYQADAVPAPEVRGPNACKGKWGEHYPILQSRFDMSARATAENLLSWPTLNPCLKTPAFD